MILSRRDFIILVGAALLHSILPPEQSKHKKENVADTTGIFPFDLGAALEESRVSQFSFYISKIFLPLVRR